MNLGISTYTYTWAIGVPGQEPEHPLDELGLLTKTADMGLSLLQIADNLPLHTFTNDRLQKLSKQAQRMGIELETGTRGLTSELVSRYLDIASQLNSRILRFVVDGPGYEPSVKQIQQVIEPFVQVFEKRGITLAIENHDRLKAAEFVDIVSYFNHPQVGICLDTVNSLGAGEGLNEVIKQLAPLTVNLHVKDFSIKRVFHKMGFVVEGMPAGQGMLPINELLQTLTPYNRCHSAILELWTPPANSISETVLREEQWAQQSINYLKTLDF